MTDHMNSIMSMFNYQAIYPSDIKSIIKEYLYSAPTAFSVETSGLWLFEQEKDTYPPKTYISNGVVINDELPLISEEKPPSLFDFIQATSGVSVTNVATDKLTWTDEVYRIYGLPTSYTLSAEKVISFFSPDAQKILRMAFIRAITHQEPYTLELPFTGANCEHKWIRATGKIRYTHQIATHVYGSFEDISERKNILASEKYTSKYLKNLVDNIDDCIITIFANGTIFSVNNEVKKSFGYSLNELIGQNISKLILKPFSSSHDRCKDKQLQTDITKIIGTCRELPAIKKNGTIFPIELSISEVLDQCKISYSELTLEITENALIADFDLVISKMEFLKQKGIHFSIDDFGTGYSSLSYIHHLPISELKIDKYFVDDIKNAVDEVPIINTIIQLAKSLNLKVVAKGVESKEQLDYLRQHKCDVIQGYYFSKPLNPEQWLDIWALENLQRIITS